MPKPIYVITGGAGFIGSAFVWKLNAEGIDDILIVDELSESDKWKNLLNSRFVDYLHKDQFLQMVRKNAMPFMISTIVHMGACTSTTERNADYLMENNYRYTRELAEWAIKKEVRFIYASSASTYGDGSMGFSDDDQVTIKLRPLNMYGYSKQIFDLYALRSGLVQKIAGVKFFNVFGPNEYHKGDMSSIIYKAFQQIHATGKVRLFKSYKSEYRDGMQMRDFVYVKDCVEILWWLLQNQNVSGIFNLGTGKARTWNDLVHAVFSAMGVKPQIEYIEMPTAIRDRYQYITEAKMDKLLSKGCTISFRSLEESVRDYITNYLRHPDPYLKTV